MVRLSLLISCGLFCACAPADPLDGFTFKPPAGWTHFRRTKARVFGRIRATREKKFS